MNSEKFRSLFEMFTGPLPPADGNGEVQVNFNPFRHDPNPSLFFNVEDGRFNDFGSDDFKGDAYNFYMQVMDCNFNTAKKAVDEIVGITENSEINVPLPIGSEIVNDYHMRLLNDGKALAYLLSDRGVSLETIKKRNIGYNGERYIIPIYNRFGTCVNLRKYKANCSGKDKMMNYAKGYGSARLYPIDNLVHSEIILHEGEWDSLLQESNGFNAVTTTGGAGTWLTQWNEQFKGKTVYICYDNDAQHVNATGEIENIGLKGATKVATNLYGIAKKVYVVVLPVSGAKDDKDVSDFYAKGKTAEDFKKVLQSAKLFQPSETEAENAGVAHKVTLQESRNSKYAGKRVNFNVVVVGKDTAPYNVPGRIKYTCSSCGIHEQLCSTCPCNQGEYTLNIQNNETILELIKCTTQQQHGVLKSRAGIPGKCSLWEKVVEKNVNVEELVIAPEVNTFAEWSGKSESYLLQQAFFIDREIESNRGYQMTGLMTPTPWTQHVTFVLDKAETLQDDISCFKMSPDVYEKLKVFQTDNVAEKFLEIAQDFEDNVTHIVGRKDLLTGIDLVYHSVLDFKFQGMNVSKGWVEMLCLGDTRTGKSESVTKMLHHYGLGEMSTAENSSYAGLVGGLQQAANNRWLLTWGKLPLNDGKLFVLDEVSGLSYEDIGRMSGLRSSGIAEVTKIQTERTRARVRTIWLSNPRSNRAMNEYSQGIWAVKELVGQPEDIARFDFALSVSRDEVSLKEINKTVGVSTKVPHKYTSELSRQLVLWAWSRTNNDVEFETEAVSEILDKATEMGEFYSSKVPLVEGANQRMKIARLAVAVAARVFSTDATGQKVIVKREHVEFAVGYLNQIYSKPSLGYREFSEREHYNNSVGSEGVQSMLDEESFAPLVRAIAMLGKGFNEQMLLTFLEDSGQGGVTVHAFIHRLVTLNLVDQSRGMYYARPVLVRAANNVLREAVEKMDSVNTLKY